MNEEQNMPVEGVWLLVYDEDDEDEGQLIRQERAEVCTTETDSGGNLAALIA